MYLTVDFLEKNKVCGPGLEWFKKHYANGIELMDFFDECRHYLPSRKLVEIIYWGYTHLQYNENELEKMKEVLCIDTSSQVWMSENVYDSEKVARASEIYGSRNIESSSEITQSSSVSESSKVRASHFISGGYNIENSTFIVGCTDIKNCSDVCHSDSCSFSRHFYRSRNCKNSEGLIDCINTSHSAFSRELESCEYCLFCENLEGKKFHIFNQPIGAKEFFIWDALIRTLFQNKPELEGHFINVARSEETYCGYEIITTSNPYSLFSKWNQDLFGELRKYPGYNDWLMYKLTMNQNAFEVNN